MRRAFLPACLAVLLLAAWVVPLPYFAERPGALLGLDEHVEVEGSSALDGDFLLTVANLRRATTVDVLVAAVDGDTTLVGAQRLVPPGVEDAAYFDRQRDLFRETADVAAAVGLRAAGYPVDPSAVLGDGARVLRVVPGLPAEGLLAAGDVVVEAGGASVTTAQELGEAVGAADGALELVYLRGGERAKVLVRPEVRTVAGRPRPVIGVEIQTHNARIDLPISVRVASGRIGGPSAGLLLALTVYDKAAAEVDLAAGRAVAGTGGLTANGLVEPVGGIGAKVLAAHRAGADLFLLPEGQEETARAALPAGSDLRLVPVATFDEAVEALRGGRATLAAAPLASPGGRR